MKRLDEKLARIRAGHYRKQDFIIADAKDPDMGPSLTWSGPKREPDGSWTRYRTREEFLDQIRAIVAQDIVDIMLMSASNMERLCDEGLFKDSAVKPAIRANDTSDIWRMRGATYHEQPSRPFRSASIPRTMYGTVDADAGCRDHRHRPRPLLDHLQPRSRRRHGLAGSLRRLPRRGRRVRLQVLPRGVQPQRRDRHRAFEILPHYINDNILRCIAGVHQADRPQFLKIVYNGPKALEELTSFDPSVIVGVLGGGAGTTRDCFELLSQGEKYGARVALFGRKINLAEAPLAIIAMMRQVVDGNLSPQEAVRAYHGELQKQRIKPLRPLEDDMAITEAVLQQQR